MIRLERLCIAAGEFAMDDLSFTIPDGQYGVLMGPTGSGKTTLVETICGLRPPRRGRIILGARDVTYEPPGNRGIGYVPQDGALFPTLTVREHLGFALTVRRRPPLEIDQRVEELGARLGILPLLNRKPAGLSGGERQRVALGRALAARPSVLVLDEPLSALDEALRSDLQDLLKTIQRENGVSVLHVTHDRSEARALADVSLLLTRHRIEEQTL